MTVPHLGSTKSFQFDFRLVYGGEMPLYRQICQRFRDAVLQGNLPVGARVPSIRILASELQVSRSTVEKAYDQLTGEGLFVCSGQAGTSISHQAAPRSGPKPSDPPGSRTSTEARHSSNRVESAPRPFQLGLPALDAFPESSWNILSQRVWKNRPFWNQMVDPQGSLPLRQAIAAYLQVSRGIACASSQVFVTTGYKQSMGILLSALAMPRENVAVEDPIYPPTLSSLRQAGMGIVPIPVDEAGMDLERLKALPLPPKVAVVTPANQSPTGSILSLRRRGELLAWASENQTWILEDDYDSEFCVEGRLQPTLCGLDRAGRTIYLGTFSKALHPALRIAYAVVPSSLVEPVRRVAEESVDGSALIVQATLASFMSEGQFGCHLKKMRGLYKKRRNLVIDALRRRLDPFLEVEPEMNGLRILLPLRDNRNDAQVATKADLAGLRVGALSRRYLSATPRNALLLNYANVPDAKFADAAASTLAACFRA